MPDWPNASDFAKKRVGPAQSPLHSFTAECTIDDQMCADRVGIEITAPNDDPATLYHQVIENLELLHEHIPQTLETLRGPAAWSFQEVYGIDVSPDDVTRKVYLLSITFFEDGRLERWMEVRCAIHDRFETEPNIFSVELDEHGAIINGQLND